MTIARAFLTTELFQGLCILLAPVTLLAHFSIMPTVKWHKQSNLSVLHPLSDTVSCTLLDASNERGVVDDAVEDLPALQRIEAC